MEWAEYAAQVKHGFTQRHKGGVVFYTIPSFDAYTDVAAGFTSRIGGVSEGCFSSLNFSLKREGNADHFRENFRRAAAALGLNEKTIVLNNYEHGTSIVRVIPADCGKGLFIETDLPFCDALIITQPGVTATSMHADCAPLFFLDPVRKVACVAHAGWRGVHGGLPEKIVEEFVVGYGSKKEDILAAIGPHILGCCFEVGDEVAGLFEETFGAFTTERRNGRAYVNMQHAILSQLMEKGVPPENCTCAGLCTHCLPSLFYSHRRDRGETGAMASLIAFREKTERNHSAFCSPACD